MSYSQKAVDKWHKSNVKRYGFAMMLKSDADVIARLDSVPNKNDYVRRLIRADIEREKEQAPKD